MNDSDLCPETVSRRYSVKKVFLKISQRKITMPESFFNKVAGLRLAALLKKRLW